MRGAVLAGGAATRYGGVPKGLLLVGGARILDRVVEGVQAVTGALPLLIANAPGASAWRPDLKTIPDARPGFGSLGGIYTAVTAAPESVLCVAWDMPFVPDALLRALVDGPAIARRLETGDLKAISFHTDVSVGILSLAQVRGFGDPDELFFNVNTPDELERAEALWR